MPGRETPADSVEQWLDQNGWSASDPERAWALNTLITQEYSIDPDVLGTHAYLEGKDDRGSSTHCTKNDCEQQSQDDYAPIYTTPFDARTMHL